MVHPSDKAIDYLFIVTFPSLENTRRSDRKVVFGVTTKGFCVDPSRYSVTLGERPEQAVQTDIAKKPTS